jgi:hypothetical protein
VPVTEDRQDARRECICRTHDLAAARQRPTRRVAADVSSFISPEPMPNQYGKTIVARHAEAPGRRMRYCFTHHEVWDTHHRDDACSDVLDLGGQHDPAELNRAAPMYAIAMASRGRPRRGTRSARGRRHA